MNKKQRKVIFITITAVALVLASYFILVNYYKIDTKTKIGLNNLDQTEQNQDAKQGPDDGQK
jgi:cell division protein FtsL